MGAIQGSINSMLGTIATATAFGKHTQTQQKQLDMANEKEALAIKQAVGDYEQEAIKHQDLEEAEYDASEKAKIYREGTYDETGKVARNRITGRFISSEEIASDETLLGLEKAAETAANVSMEHANAMVKQKELLKQRMEFFKKNTGKTVDEYMKNKTEVKK